MKTVALRKIVREELQKALQEILEHPFESKPEIKTAEDEIIYDYNQGTTFSYEHLQEKIENLDKYQLSEYLPINSTYEKWIFETEQYGRMLIVEIKHKLSDNKSYWKLILSSLEGGASFPEVEIETPGIVGYQNFINYINTKISNLILPKKF